ncbi:phosphomevalonate kinase [Microbacterium telephonicum]|uniref:phosphomevalonate kinase n=1 Tax=Microbacterium telephonicum TaxID=1714841 RepID=A0A498C0K4_9MICO|nr:phosphomevalonate kinase [Microbacterium telephonicum]RLK49195.1 phosphomevalonate kinase [Microbacterium telephonicum]
MSATIVARAPGKLFVAGEYAVVTPGEPAVLVAVDRFLTVSLTETTGAGGIHSPESARPSLRWTRDAGGLVVAPEDHSYDYVLSALTVIERLRAERGIAPRLYDLTIDSGLDDASGRKFGLGSSAAVTVATIRAIDRFYRLALDRRTLYQLALLATIRIAPSASGGDLAASTFGGWIGYRSPDREMLRRLLDAGDAVASVLESDAWEHLEIVRLRPPRDLGFFVGWTGEPASTVRLVDAVGRGAAVGAVDHAGFLRDSRACVTDLWAALDAGDDAATLDALRRARGLLQALGAQAGLAIETPRLAALCDAAETAGAAAKSSGAGGGDCGIVLAPASADVRGMLDAWEAQDIRRLTIAVHPPEGGDDVL